MTGRDAICERYIRPLAPIPSGAAPDLSKMERFSAMLFDVYGTLLISGAGDIGLNRRPIERIDDLQGLLKRCAIDRTPQSLLSALERAIKNAHRIRKHQGIDHPEVDIVRIWRQVLGSDDMHWVKNFALEVELLVNPVYPMPGFEELLLACKTRKIPMGIISNAQFYTPFLLEWFIGERLERHGFDPRLTFFSYRIGHAKPYTAMFQQAVDTLSESGVPAASVLVVGNDMRNDVLPAASVGFKTALFAGDRRSLRLRESDDCCSDLSPDLIVTDLRQLIAGTGNP